MTRTLAACVLFLGVVLVTLSCGCAASAKVVRVVETGAKVVAVAEPLMLTAYRESQRLCLEEFADPDAAAVCVERIRVRWAPVMEALGDYREAYCAVLPDRCGQ